MLAAAVETDARVRAVPGSRGGFGGDAAATRARDPCDAGDAPRGGGAPSRDAADADARGADADAASVNVAIVAIVENDADAAAVSGVPCATSSARGFCRRRRVESKPEPYVPKPQHSLRAT